MKKLLKIAAFLSLAVNLSGQKHPDEYISVAFSIDGKKAACGSFKAELRLNGSIIQPKQVGQRFEVPDEFKKPAPEWSDNDKVDINLSCNGHDLIFPKQHPAFIRDGSWELGIAHPLYALREYGYTHEFDRGTSLGYLIFQGEPGIVTFTSGPDSSADKINALQREQAEASGERARDIAYELAVFHVDYQKNREYLLSVLNRCLSRPKDSAEDDECSSDLMEFIVNLYWRGDDVLLPTLLRVADSRKDVISEIGSYYSDLLTRRGKSAIEALESLPEEQQIKICKLAFDDDLESNSPKLSQVQNFLRDENRPAATRCLSALKN